MGKVHIDLNQKTILVTGSPGFIGANLVLRLLKELSGGTVISFDNMNDYYDPALKEYRLNLIEEAAKGSFARHVFIRGSIADKTLVDHVFAEYKPAIVVNLAAQVGVRYSIDHPDVYIESNLIGFYNILEACRHSYDNGAPGVKHLVYASSSSVYGGSRKVPFSTDDKADAPVSLYAATKKSNELLAHSYSKLYSIPSTGLRFFTVYGPAGRPDMFYFSATQKLAAGEKIQIFNYGNCRRDFTYVDDIVEGVIRVMQGAPERAAGEDGLPLPPLRGLQHRRRHTGEPFGFYFRVAGGTGPRRRPSSGLRFYRSSGARSHAARRRPHHLCRQRRSRSRLRLPSCDRDSGGASQICGVV